MKPSDFLRKAVYDGSIPRLEKPHLNVTTALMPSSFNIGSILQYGEKPVIPQRVPMTANLKPGTPQHKMWAFTGGNLAPPTDGKAKYTIPTQLLGEQQELRYVEYLGRQSSDNEEARDMLQEIMRSKRTLKEQQELDNLLLMGLTEDEAKEVIRKQFIENVVKNKGVGHLRNHQEQKAALIDLARTRGLVVGVPPSLATHEGVATADSQFSNKEKYLQQKVLEYKAEKARNHLQAELDKRFSPENMSLYGRPTPQMSDIERVNATTTTERRESAVKKDIIMGGAGARAIDDEPNDSWSNKRLIAYMKERGISAMKGQSKNKNNYLTAISRWKAFNTTATR